MKDDRDGRFVGCADGVTRFSDPVQLRLLPGDLDHGRLKRQVHVLIEELEERPKRRSWTC
jgi:hypothetical protein